MIKNNIMKLTKDNYHRNIAREHIEGLRDYFLGCIEDSYFEGSYENIRQKELEFLDKSINEIGELLYELVEDELKKNSFERIFRYAMEERVCDFFNGLSSEALSHANEESIEEVLSGCSNLAIRYLDGR